MKEMKDSSLATVHIGFDGTVHKRYRGPYARERFENEHRMLLHLEAAGCEFVPRVLQSEPDSLYLVTTNCGRRVDRISPDRMQELFRELEEFGVKHGDQAERNITYNPQQGRFCIIDFEFATFIETGEGLTLEEVESSRDGISLERKLTGE